jgi:hypothetical protein
MVTSDETAAANGVLGLDTLGAGCAALGLEVGDSVPRCSDSVRCCFGCSVACVSGVGVSTDFFGGGLELF